MRVSFRKQSLEDVERQFRYYLMDLGLPAVAMRFRDAVKRTVDQLRQRPLSAPRFSSRKPQLSNLRSWPVAGFRAIRIYFEVAGGQVRVVRVLHGKRNVRRILEGEDLA